MTTGHFVQGNLATADKLNSCLLQTGTFAARPAAGQKGRRYWATDTGQLFRDNGTTWDTIIDKDLAAGSASLRTLGTGATQAAAGNHTHTPTNQASTFLDDNGSVLINSGTETDLISVSSTPGSANRIWAIYGSALPHQDGCTTVTTYTIRLYFDTTVLQTISGFSISGVSKVKLVHGSQSNPSVALHTVKVTVQRTAGVCDHQVFGTIGLREISLV